MRVGVRLIVEGLDDVGQRRALPMLLALVPEPIEYVQRVYTSLVDFDSDTALDDVGFGGSEINLLSDNRGSGLAGIDPTADLERAATEAVMGPAKWRRAQGGGAGLDGPERQGSGPDSV